MKLVITSDLHQRLEKWDDMVPVVRTELPRFVMIAGDLLPKATFTDQKAFFADLRGLLQQMKKTGPLTVLTYLGNDDFHVLEPMLDELQDQGLCVNLNDGVHREEGLIFCGMNRVRDYPFGYKHWCVPDGDFVACPQQYDGEGVTLDERGGFVRLANLIEHLTAKPSIADELNRLKERLRPGEMERSIWMVHQPPSSLGMDICTGGLQVGSPTVLKFIKENQPLLGCSGHIHESPHQPDGRWMAHVGKTVWVQPGQVDHRLHYVSLSITDSFGLENIQHSIFGMARR